MSQVEIRDANAKDFGKIVELNREFVHFTSEMDVARLTLLDRFSAYHRVVVSNGEVLAFLLVMGPGTEYDSVNYRWFSQRYENFFYIDRIVISGSAHRQGLGKTLYDDLFTFAKMQKIPVLTCEYYTQPANPVSAAFHQKYGFEEVGSQVIVEGEKVVSMQAVEL